MTGTTTTWRNHAVDTIGGVDLTGSVADGVALDDVAAFEEVGRSVTDALGMADAVTVDGVATFFACEWEQLYATPDFNEAIEQQCAGVWPTDQVTSMNVGPAVFVELSDAGLTNRGDYFSVKNAGTNSRQLYFANLINAQEDHWGRIYIRGNNTTFRQDHHLNMGDNAGCFSLGFIHHDAGGPSLMTTNWDSTGLLANIQRYTQADVDNAGDEDYLTLDQWYLYEWQIAWSSSTRFRADIWIHEVDSLGMITTEDKWTTADMWPNDLPGSGTNMDTAQEVAGDFSYIQAGYATGDERMYQFGNAARGSGAVTDGGYMDYASFALSNEGRLRDQAVTTGTTR